MQMMLNDPRTRAKVLKKIEARRARLAGDKPLGDGEPMPQAADTITPKSNVETEHSNKAGFEKKKYEKVTDGTASGELGTKVTTTDGGTKDVDERKVKGTADLKDGPAGSITYSRSNEQSGDDASVKSGHSVGASGNKHGGKVSGGIETEAKIGEEVHKDSVDGGIGVKDGKLDADLSSKNRVENKDGALEKSRSIAIDDDKVKLGTATKQELKEATDEVDADGKKKERTSSKGTDTSVAVGKDGASIDHGRDKENADGTKSRTSVGADVNWKEGTGSVNAGKSISDKDGNAASVKVKAGIEVHAEVEQDPDSGKWVVKYTRAKSVGASGGVSKSGAGASVGGSASEYENGSRTFEKESEAREYKETIEKEITEHVKETGDPKTVAGAMKLQVGETRGSGNTVGANAGVTGSFEGASAGVSGHTSSTQEVNVTRVSETVFEVTLSDSSEKGGDVSGGGASLTVNRGESSGQHTGLTASFDLSTDEGKKAFEKFVTDHKEPTKGGEVVSKEEGKENETHDGTSLALEGTAQEKAHTSEKHVADKKGNHDKYEGDHSQDQKAGFIGHHIFGDVNKHSSVEIEGRRENGKDDGYTIKGNVNSESGKYNRNKMQALANGAQESETWDESKVKQSGEWTMTTDVDVKTMNRVAKGNSHFDGAKTDDDKMRALGQWVADDGAKAIGAIERTGASLTWDLELKGDPNFPGRPGREKLEALMRQNAEALAKSPGNGATVAANAQAQIDLLKSRRQAVASQDNYTDLPERLRQQQLQLIDREIAGFEMLRHRGAAEAVKNNPGEDIGKVALRANDSHSSAGEGSEQKQISQLRDEMTLADGAIAQGQKMCDEADVAIRDAQRFLDLGRPGAGQNATEASKLFGTASGLYKSQRDTFRATDEIRMSFLKNLGDPHKALPLAQDLVAKLKASESAVGLAQAKYNEAAQKQILVTKPAGLAKHAKFWQEVRETLSDEDAVASYDEPAPSSSRDDDDGKPSPQTSMKL